MPIRESHNGGTAETEDAVCPGGLRDEEVLGGRRRDELPPRKVAGSHRRVHDTVGCAPDLLGDEEGKVRAVANEAEGEFREEYHKNGEREHGRKKHAALSRGQRNGDSG